MSTSLGSDQCTADRRAGPALRRAPLLLIVGASALARGGLAETPAPGRAEEGIVGFLTPSARPAGGGEASGGRPGDREGARLGLRGAARERPEHAGGQARDLGVALCILGELPRLEIESKITNIVEPIIARSVNVDVFLSLETGEPTYNNADSDLMVRGRQSATASHSACYSSRWGVRDVEGAFAPYFRDGRFGPHKIEEVNTARWPKLYPGEFYKKNHFPQSEHISNVLGQMRHQKDCAEMIQNHENSTGAKYAAVLKVRENTLALRPVVPEMLVSIDKVVVKRCASWYGVNDKVMALPRKYLEKSLGSIYDLMQKVMKDPVLDPRLRTMSQMSLNTETVVLHALRANGVPVFQEDITRKIDGGRYLLPFADGRCQSGSESGRGDRWCVVSHCKDCHPALPWTLNVTCATQNGFVSEGTDAKC